MIVYRDSMSGKKIGVSRKVMSSFFFYNNRFLRSTDQSADYFIVRNPYERLVSLYADKCARKIYPGNKEQHCQSLLAEAAGLKSARQLDSISAFQMVVALDKCWIRDEHFLPQTFGLTPARMGKLIKLETDLPLLESEIAADFSAKRNATDHAQSYAYFGNESCEIVTRIYQDDFNLLGYSTEI